MLAAITTGFHTIPVLFENDHIIAVDKPENLASIPERNRENVSLQKTFPRLMLHALSIRLLLDPVGQKVAVTSELPSSFSEVLCSIQHPRR